MIRRGDGGDRKALLEHIRELERETAELHVLRRRLQASESRLAHAQRIARMGSWETHVQTGQSEWSEEIFRLFGLEPGAVQPRHKRFLEFVHAEDRSRVEAVLERALRGGSRYDVVFRVAEIPHERILHSQGEVEFDADGRPVRIFGTLQDVTEQEQSRRAVRESEERFRLIAETIDDVFWMSTPGVGRMVYVSPGYERIWGRSCQSLYEDPRSFIDAVHPDDRQRVAAGIKQHAQGQWNFEYRIIRPDGAVRWISDRGFPIRDEGGRLVMMTGVASDITERKDAETRLQRMLADLRRIQGELETTNRRLNESNRLLQRLALNDSLTGVANRRYLRQYLAQEWRREMRYRRPISLILADIDDFKAYNDRYGHLQGDLCLKRIAVALGRALRRPTDLLARFGGEEFVVVLPETDLAGATHLAETLRRGVVRLGIPHESATTPGRIVTLSLGVTTVDTRSVTPSVALDRADRALYAAKNSGKNRVVTSGENSCPTPCVRRTGDEDACS